MRNFISKNQILIYTLVLKIVLNDDLKSRKASNLRNIRRNREPEIRLGINRIDMTSNTNNSLFLCYYIIRSLFYLWCYRMFLIRAVVEVLMMIIIIKIKNIFYQYNSENNKKNNNKRKTYLQSIYIFNKLTSIYNMYIYSLYYFYFMGSFIYYTSIYLFLSFSLLSC